MNMARVMGFYIILRARRLKLVNSIVRCPRTGRACSTAKFRLSALARYLRCRRVGRHRLRCKLSSKLVVRLTIHGDKDRRLAVGPWSLDVVAYVVALLLRRESGCRPLAGIDPKTRTLDILVIDDRLAVAGRDVVSDRRSRQSNETGRSLARGDAPPARRYENH